MYVNVLVSTTTFLAKKSTDTTCHSHGVVHLDAARSLRHQMYQTAIKAKQVKVVRLEHSAIIQGSLSEHNNDTWIDIECWATLL